MSGGRRCREGGDVGREEMSGGRSLAPYLCPFAHRFVQPNRWYLLTVSYFKYMYKVVGPHG